MNPSSIPHRLESAWAARRAALELEGDARVEALGAVLTELSEVSALLNEDAARRAHLLHLRAHVEWDLRRAPHAEALWRESVSLLRPLNRPLELAHKLRHLADLLAETGELEEARGHCEEALTLYEAVAHASPLDVANALRRMALIEERRGDPAAARALWQRVRTAYADLGLADGVTEAEARLSRG